MHSRLQAEHPAALPAVEVGTDHVRLFEESIVRQGCGGRDAAVLGHVGGAIEVGLQVRVVTIHYFGAAEGGAFDVDSDSQIFKLDTTSGFWDITFGNVAVTGLSESFILGDLTVNGSFALGGGLGNVDLIYIPEVPVPQPIYLLGAGIGIIATIRKKLKLYTPYP